MNAFTRIRIHVGQDGLGYYTAVYGNGEPGPRSEGYGTAGQTPDQAVKLAVAAATRDFPDLAAAELIEVAPAEHGTG